MKELVKHKRQGSKDETWLGEKVASIDGRKPTRDVKTAGTLLTQIVQTHSRVQCTALYLFVRR